LWICLSGEEQAKEKVKPFLQMLGKKVNDFGPKPEAANIIKVAGNFMIASVIEMLSEAFSLMKENEIQPEQFLALLTDSLFPGPVFQTYGKIIAQQKFSPPGFKLALGLKDLDLFINSFEKKPDTDSFAQNLRTLFLESLKKGRENMDWSAISLLSEERR
jgi:3-hydroxyisobutyrate dehydrogenase-like beta-hydroxyacid dehydrogenase